MRITKRKLKNIIKNLVLENIENEELHDLDHQENKPSTKATFKKRFVNNPVSAISYFKSLVENSDSEYMKFMNVFLDLLLSLEDISSNTQGDIQEFKDMCTHLINDFPKEISQYVNRSEENHISSEFIKEFGYLLELLGRKLKQGNRGVDIEEELDDYGSDDNLDYIYKTR